MGAITKGECAGVDGRGSGADRVDVDGGGAVDGEVPGSGDFQLDLEWRGHVGDHAVDVEGVATDGIVAIPVEGIGPDREDGVEDHAIPVVLTLFESISRNEDVVVGIETAVEIRLPIGYGVRVCRDGHAQGGQGDECLGEHWRGSCVGKHGLSTHCSDSGGVHRFQGSAGRGRESWLSCPPDAVPLTHETSIR
ncbi:MAG: hypothetical protein CMJ40_04075 [Phycisphaerae bacterium]|nr:hypothetical protein [Phycisphaerae bacterium]